MTSIEIIYFKNGMIDLESTFHEANKELTKEIERLKEQAKQDQSIKIGLLRSNLQLFTELQQERTKRTERANQ